MEWIEKTKYNRISKAGSHVLVYTLNTITLSLSSENIIFKNIIEIRFNLHGTCVCCVSLNSKLKRLNRECNVWNKFPYIPASSPELKTKRNNRKIYGLSDYEPFVPNFFELAKCAN